MRKFLAIISSLFAAGGSAVAQQSTQTSTLAGYGSGLYSLGSQQSLPRDADEVRLLLQYAADQGGRVTSSPSELSGAIQTAEQAGWLKMDSPPSIPTTNEKGEITGSYSTGFTSWDLTEDGRKELAARNAALGSAATRMAHGTQFVPGAGVVVYGAARRVPLTAPLSFQDGIPISR